MSIESSMQNKVIELLFVTQASSLHCMAVVVRMWWCKCKRVLLLEIHYEIGSGKHLSIAVIWFDPLRIVRSRNLWRELSSCYVYL